MRTLARYHLQRAGFDPAGFYRELLARDPVPALRGLGDCGTVADAASAATHLGDPDPAVRRAAVVAVTRLDDAGYAPRLIERLADDVVGVAATAARSLSKAGLSPVATQQLWEIMSGDQRPQVVRSCLRAARGLPKWSQLQIGLRSTASAEASLREAGVELVDYVLTTWNRSFIAPTPDEASELAVLLDAAHGLGDEKRIALASAMKTYGIVSETTAELSTSEARGSATPPRRLWDAVRSIGRTRRSAD
jgi:hypothetical protein